MERAVAVDEKKENLTGELIRFAIPLMLSGLLQQLYSWADAFILGNVEGEGALAAVGATVSISEFLILLITGFSVGLSIMTAHTFGNGKKEEIQKILSIFCILTGGFFLLTGIMCAVLTPQFIRLIQTPAEIAADAEIYIRIIFLGIPCIAVYNIYSAVLRGIGDSRIPFASVTVSVLVNVILDVVLVGFYRLGVKGAALATVFSQVILLAVIMAGVAWKYPHLKLQIYGIRECREVLKRGLALGLPTAVQSSITACGNILLQKFMNSFGQEVVAAVTIAYRIDSVVMLPIINLGSAISTMTAQSIGAGQRQRAGRGFRAGMLIMTVTTVVLSWITHKVNGSLIRLFHLEGEAAVTGQLFFSIITRFYVIYGLAVAVKSYLEGKGDVIFSGVAGLLTLGARILFSYGLRSRYESSIIAYAEGFSWILLLALCSLRYLKVKNR